MRHPSEHPGGHVDDPSGLDVSDHDRGQLARGKAFTVEFEETVPRQTLDGLDASLGMPAVGMIRAIQQRKKPLERHGCTDCPRPDRGS